MKNILLSAICAVTFSITTFSAEPSVWSVNSRADVLKGDARGVSIDQSGAITIAPRWAEVFRSDQAFIWSTAVDAAGNIYLGTGGEGKVFRVDPAGKGVLFSDLAELNVTGLAVGRNGEIFAATSPDGKVYRIDQSGNATTYFEPNEKYIWSLAVTQDGALAVATGDGGRIYKVKAAGAAREASLLFDTSEAHVISLATDRQGNLYAGTDPGGIVMRFGPDGKPFGLLDSPLREIHELAPGPDGSLYILALGDSASAAKPAEAAAATPAPEQPTVTVEKASVTATPEAVKSKYDLTGAKTAVYRIFPHGGTEILWSSPTVVGFSLHAHETGTGVLLGTSEKGRIFNIANDGSTTLLIQSDADQISTVRSGGNSLIATSSNPGNLYRFGGSAEEGTYESSVLDAKTTASWGRLWYTGSGNISIHTRSGNTSKPDETWSQWSTAIADSRGSQVSSPRARYLQWRAVLKSSSVTARLVNTNVAFLPSNTAPEILSIQVLPTNVGLVANPPVQIDPNIELSGMEPAAFGIPVVAVPPRRVYQRGATSLQWTSEDRDGDKLIFDVYYREVGETEFKLLRAGLTDPFLAVDGQSLADGQYVFRIVASDRPSNPAELALSGEKLTEPIHIDNTPPTVSVVSSTTEQIIFEATDRSSYITRAEYSINAGDWTPIYAQDGIADSPTERFGVRLPQAAGEYSVTLRAHDVNGNSGHARRIVRK